MDASDDAFFQAAMIAVLRDEGGFQKNAHDRGNWTGGAVGVGELNGTNFGISAASYPDLDIEHLSREQAIDIYYRDWWCRYVFFAELAYDESVKVFDLAVNMGVHRAVILLQEAANACNSDAPIAVDGIAGPATVAAANACNARSLLAWVKVMAEAFHRRLAAEHPEDARFLAGWLARDAA